MDIYGDWLWKVICKCLGEGVNGGEIGVSGWGGRDLRINGFYVLCGVYWCVFCGCWRKVEDGR